MRFVNSHFCRESYDTFRPPPELISLMRKTHSEYLEDVKNTVTHQEEEVKKNIKVHGGYMSVERVQVSQKRSTKSVKT